MDKIKLPAFFCEPGDDARGEIKKIRINFLRNNDMTAALESLCDLVVEQYSSAGIALTDSMIELDVLEAVWSLATQARLWSSPSSRFFSGESGMARGGVRTDNPTPFGAYYLPPHFRMEYTKRLHRKLNSLKADLEDGSIGRLPAKKPGQNWLESALRQLIWSTTDLEGNGGPDHKTTDRYLAGGRISRATLKKIVDAANSQKRLKTRIELDECPLQLERHQLSRKPLS